MMFKKEGFWEPSDWTNFRCTFIFIIAIDDLSGRKMEFGTVAQQFVYPFGGKA